jgi:xanthine dehydrogenase YagS FAD-binding subunit
MYPFTYVAVTQEGQALNAASADPRARFLAGGTNLIDDMKLGIETPDRLIDVNGLPLNGIEPLPDGGLRIGAMVRNSDLGWDERVRTLYPVLSEAILSGASPQLRNLATTAGNLLQRTRCDYFRDVSYPNCNKRNPGSGCAAIPGYNRIHAILGTSDACIATHPSDMCVAMAALDAEIRTASPKGERVIPINEFYVPYGDDPAKENVLAPGELITAVDLPPMKWARRSHYLKVRDRASYAFALSSAAVALDLDDGGAIRSARIALGGVATKPWRATAAEQSLAGKKPDEQAFAAAAEVALQGARPQAYNGFKVELCKRTIVAALARVAAMA